MLVKTCADCGDPFDTSGYRSNRARCSECATAQWEANAIARGRCPAALRKEALAGFIGPKLPRSNKRREARRLRKLASPQEGLVRCNRCRTDLPKSEFYWGKDGRPSRPCIPCRNKERKEKRAALRGSPESLLETMAALERNRIRKYGITNQRYVELLAEQNGVCKICTEPETLTRHGVVVSLSIDHCHTTGRVRGLLCSACNRGLGLFRDLPFILRAAADYLERDGDYPKI